MPQSLSRVKFTYEKNQNKYTKTHSRPSIGMKAMSEQNRSDIRTSHSRIGKAYEQEKPRLVARIRAMGRSLEEAEDLVHDVYAETMERIPIVSTIRNLPAWINSLLTRRLIDSWRHEQVRRKSGETDVAEETLQEIISGIGLNPLDAYVRDCLVDALNDALHVLPREQRRVIEYQVFGGMTFREIAEKTGEGIDTLTARKRYALQNLSRALKHWIDE